MCLADYRRFISYMYTYKEGNKDTNVGYVKVESKQKKTKITVNIKSNKIYNRKISIYLLYRGSEPNEKENMNLKLIEEVECNKEDFIKVYSSMEDNLFDTGLKTSNVAGIMIKIDNEEYIGTEWDDNGIHIDRISKAVEADEKSDVNKKFVDSKVVDNKPEEVMNFNTFNESKIIKEEVASIIDKEDSKKEDSEKDDNKVIDKPVRIEGRKNTYSSRINRIFEKFPGMYPFEDDEIMDCIKLEPRDIGLFPMDKWPLANNSFLLHGYYTYRHLIFARMKTNNVIQYILGVPGIFRDREKFMARMFGFNNFKGVRNKPLDNGEFGYWYTVIKM